MISLSVDVDIPADLSLLGKYTSDLQEDIEVDDDAITGTLKWVADYSAAFGEDEKAGNFIAVHAGSDPGVTISAEVIGGYHGPQILDTDGILIARIESTTQKLRFTAMQAGKVTKVRDYSLAELTLTPETATVELSAADANDDGVYSETELKALTKAQLLELAESLGVDGVSSSSTKAQIIAAILAAQEEG